MRSTIFYLGSLITLLFFSCVNDTKHDNARYSLYSEETAMSHFLADPDRAITLIDSAVIVRNLTPQRADYLKAVVYYSATKNVTEALRICQQLIDNESWKQLPDSEDITSFQVDVYRLMATISGSLGHHLTVLKYAREGAELSHGIAKLRGDETDFLSRIGVVLCKTGQIDEGLANLRRAEELALTDDTWSSLVAYFNNTKKIYAVLSMQKRYDEEKQVISQAESRLLGLRQNISQVRHAPEAMLTDSMALEEFIQFFQKSFFAQLANIYANEQKIASVEYYLSLLAANPQANDPTLTEALVYPLTLLGRYKEAEHKIAQGKEYFKDDTISTEYLSLLIQEELLARAQGDNQRAYRLSDNIMTLKDSVNSQELKVLLADAATRYQLQNEQQRRVDAEDKLIWYGLIIALLASLLIVFGGALYIRKLWAKHKALSIKIEETELELEDVMQELNEVKDEQSDDNLPTQEMSPEEIYRRACEIMETELLYKDSQFDIGTLAPLIPTNRHYLSTAINKFSGLNFRSWMAKYRVECAKQVLRQNPTFTNDLLAEECGFSNRISLYRQFKSIEGTTPNEWLSNQGNK